MTKEELERKRENIIDELDKINEQISSLYSNALKDKYVGKYLRITNPISNDNDTYMYCFDVVGYENGVFLRGTCFTDSDRYGDYSLTSCEVKEKMIFDESYNAKNIKIISKEEFDTKLSAMLNNVQKNIERFINIHKVKK